MDKINKEVCKLFAKYQQEPSVTSNDYTFIYQEGIKEPPTIKWDDDTSVSYSSVMDIVLDPQNTISIKIDGIYRNQECICTWDQLKVISNDNKELITQEATKIAKEIVKSDEFVKHIMNEVVENILSSNDREVLNAIEERVKRLDATRFIAILEEDNEDNR